MTQVSTREKLLNVANDLFSKNGYGQTSIREIASLADVNVAAVNYHFKSKEALYWEIFFVAYGTMEEGMKEIVKQYEKLEDIVCALYDFMLSKSDFMRNAFKLFLSGDVPVPLEDPRFAQITKNPGPPGAQTLAQVVQKEAGEEVSEDGVSWVVLGLFSIATHWALKSCSSISEVAKIKNDGLNPFDPQQARKMLCHHVRASLAYLKSNPSVF